MRPLQVVVSVGTDHHRFDRLVDWAERWVERSGFETKLFVQHGTSRAPRIGMGAAMLPRDEMLQRFRAADVILTQVGPGTIFDVAALGRVPIVVPRLPQLKEHVDGHQIVFGRFMAGRGEALLAEDEATFRALADRAVAQPLITRRLPRESPAPATARVLAAVVDDVMSRPPGFVRLPRLVRRSPRRTLRRAAVQQDRVEAGDRMGAELRSMLDAAAHEDDHSVSAD